RLLADEIQRMRQRMTGLRDTLQRFGKREQELRLLAGLTPTATMVQQAGIGGPAGAWSERDSLKALGPQGQQGLAARLDVDAVARRANVLVRSLDQAYDSLSHQRERLAATPSIMPTKGWLTSAFMAMRVHPILHLARPHEGIDVTAPMGAEIEAPAAGIVTDVKWEEGYGNMITLDHGFGAGDALRALLEDSRGAGPAREAGAEDRARRLDRPLHGTAPALRGVGEPQAGGP